MQRTPLYQTLEDKGNLEDIENDGPFICKRKNAWLGKGCYFWENNIENAHWWGKNYSEGYIICRSYYDYENKNFFDFLNPIHLSDFKKFSILLEEKYNRKLTVSFVLEVMKKQDIFSQYKAIRCCPSNQNSKKVIYFNDKNENAFLDLQPPIQICVLHKSFLLNSSYEIIYPETYTNNYVL